MRDQKVKRGSLWWGPVIPAIMLVTFWGCTTPVTTPIPTSSPEQVSVIDLPDPRYKGDVSVEQSLLQRRSIRSYTDEPLTLQEVSQLLWAAQGTSSPEGLRTAPSAGRTYPLETYLIAGNVENLAQGVYRYHSAQHRLVKVLDGDLRMELAAAALAQTFIKEAAISIVFTAVYERTTQRYRDRGTRYVHMEAGHAAQNVYLQAVALNLGTVAVGAFYDDQVSKTLGLPDEEHPLYIMPVGKVKR